MRPSLDKYDYGYLRGGGIPFAEISSYYGPPHSFWWTALALITRFALGALVIVLMSVVRG